MSSTFTTYLQRNGSFLGAVIIVLLSALFLVLNVQRLLKMKEATLKAREEKRKLEQGKAGKAAEKH